MTRIPNTPAGHAGPGARPPYPQICFSGGGTRCFWHGGFMAVARETLVPAPERITAVSGGALSAAAFVTGREARLLEVMADAFQGETRNFTLADMLDGGGRSVHQRVYREVVETLVGDDDAARAVSDGPAVQVLLAHPPGDLTYAGTGSAAGLAYMADTKINSDPHHGWAQNLGLTTTLADANAAARDGRLVDLICAAATIPPIFGETKWDGRPVIDGGMADHAPMPQPDEGPTLVLCTREYRNWPEERGVAYVAPSQETEADRIDFTDPTKIHETWAHGEADARAYLKTLG